MINSAVFEKRMREPIAHVHVSDSHGDIIEVYFANGNKMYIWAFKQPYNMQAVLIDEKHNIVDDFREPDCVQHSKDYCERMPMEGRTFVVTHS